MEQQLRRLPPEAVNADDVRAARDGDAAAFERLYRAYAGRIYALCLRMTGSSARARELTQDAFVRAWEKLGSFRGESAFSTWLHRLAVNVVLMDCRSTASRREDDLDHDEVEPRYREALEQHGARIDLENAIAQLPPGARRVLVLHDIEGYSHEEIAALSGIAPGTSKAHLFRARQLLRKALER